MLTLTPNNTVMNETPLDAYYYAGYSEGFLTWEDILAMNYSSQGYVNPGQTQWIDKNIAWMKTYMASHDTVTANSLKRFFKMMEGMVQGMNDAIVAAKSEAVRWTFLDLVALNMQTELGDIDIAARGPPPAASTTTTTSAASATTTTTPGASSTTSATSSEAPTTTTTTTTTTSSTAVPTTTTAGASTTTTAPPPSPSSTSTVPDNTTTQEPLFVEVETTSSAGSAHNSTNNAGEEEQDDDVNDMMPDRLGRLHSRYRIPGHGHCSALIRITDDDLFFSHNTWSSENCMLRTMKTYNLETTVAFSGYPGQIVSVDDFFMTGNKLGVQETTNDQFNKTLIYEYVTPENTVPYFLRIMTANVWAITAPQWVEIAMTLNNGCYNNQWMVLDMKKITPQNLQNLPPETFRIVEQMPGPYSKTADVTSVLNGQKHWFSYNIPYFKEVRDMAGVTTKEEQYGDFYSYTKYARAKIFARNISSVTNLDGMKGIMRYNLWKTDPLSAIANCTGCVPKNSPTLSIAARGDLVPFDPSPTFGDLPKSMWGHFQLGAWGAIDNKISSWKMMTAKNDSVTAHIVNGPPTTHNEDLPVFKWSGLDSKKSVLSEFELRHRGQPDVFDFQFEQASFVTPNHAASPWPVHGNGNGGGGIGAGAVTGIVIGGIIGVSLVAFLVWTYKNKSEGGRRRVPYSARGSEHEGTYANQGRYQTL